jgi:hypothetical protein
MSLTYSVSQGPDYSQRSTSSQNGLTTTYKLSSSQAGQSSVYDYPQNSNLSPSQGGYVLSQNNGGPQTRILSNSKAISSNGPANEKTNTVYRTT